MQPDLAPVFNRFVGRDVAVIEEMRHFKIGDKSFDIPEARIASQDQPVLNELREVTARYGLELRLWLPGVMGTMNVNPNRLNVQIEKAADGAYRITDKIDLDGAGRLRESMATIIARGTDEDVPVMKPLKLKTP